MWSVFSMTIYTVVVTKRFTFDKVEADSREQAKDVVTNGYVWDSSHVDADDIQYTIEAEENDE